MPRRALDPGAPVEPVDFQFLSAFYEFQEHSSLHIGNLVGYELGATAVPVYLDVNRLVTEHLAVLAMTGSGKSYAVGRIIERLVALNKGRYSILMASMAVRCGRECVPARTSSTTSETRRPCRRFDALTACARPGAAVYSPQNASFRQACRCESGTRPAVRPLREDDLSEILPG
jgi:hypothetical protein